jgi:hypothetical protein
VALKRAGANVVADEWMQWFAYGDGEPLLVAGRAIAEA